MFIKEVKCQRQVKIKTINCSSIIVSLVKSFKWQYNRWVNLTWFLNKNIWKLYLDCTSNIISSNLSKYLTIWINYDYCRSLWKMTKYFFFCLFFFYSGLFLILILIYQCVLVNIHFVLLLWKEIFSSTWNWRLWLWFNRQLSRDTRRKFPRSKERQTQIEEPRRCRL